MQNDLARYANVDAADVGGAAPGELARLIATNNWSTTPLGPRAAWPVELRVALRIALGSQDPTVILFGPELRLLYNDAYASALGEAQPSEALGTPAQQGWASFFGELQPSLEACRAGRASRASHLQVELVQGGRQRVAYLTFSLVPIADDAGQIVGIFCGVADTTQARQNELRVKQVEEELRQNEARFHGLVEQAVDGIFATDAQGKYTDANTAGLQMLGYTREELLELSIADAQYL